MDFYVELWLSVCKISQQIVNGFTETLSKKWYIEYEFRMGENRVSDKNKSVTREKKIKIK